MDIANLLEECAILEKMIIEKVRHGASSSLELFGFETQLYSEGGDQLRLLLDQDDIREEFEDLRLRKQKLEAEIRSVAHVNETLSHLVAVVDEADNKCLNESYELVHQIITSYDHLKSDKIRLYTQLETIDQVLEEDADNLDSIVGECRRLAVDLQSNDRVILLLDTQNKLAEQQLDVALDKVPWEPLSDENIEELRNSKNERIADLGEAIHVQTCEINDLETSLLRKKEEKLQVLEQLARQLDLFVRRRDEAITVS